MAVGLPVIATAIGANYRIIEHGKTGFLVKTKDEWVNQLQALMTDPEIRKNIGTAARLNVEENYSIHATAPVYMAIIEAASKK